MMGHLRRDSDTGVRRKLLVLRRVGILTSSDVTVGADGGRCFGFGHDARIVVVNGVVDIFVGEFDSSMVLGYVFVDDTASVHATAVRCGEWSRRRLLRILTRVLKNRYDLIKSNNF